MGSDGSEKSLDSPLVTSKTDPRALGSGTASAPTADFDQDIVRALGQGDRRTALALCARRHGASIGRLCMALLGSQSEADDATQETLLAAHAGFDGFRGEGSLRAWLFGIARRRCARVLERRGSAKPEREEDADHRTADELLDARRRAESARQLLEQVRPTEREALLLRYTAELSFREVGEASGVDEATARKRVSRGLARLRELCKE
jgi:RNA polymerase sigma-70 factor (ECF subfamily)